MQTLFFRILFVLLLSFLFGVTVTPEDPAVYNHLIINKVVFTSEEGVENISPEITELMRFLKKEERFYYDYLISDISNLLKSGLVKDVTARVRKTGEQEVSVFFTIISNPTIEKVQISNVSVMDGAYLSASMNNIAGTVLDNAKIKDDVQIIESKYHDAGYVLARVSNVFFIDQYSTLIFNVEEGEIARIVLTGLDNLNRELVYREMSLAPGSVLNMNQLRDDRLVMMKLGYFSKVSVPNVVPSSVAPGKVDVVYDLSESKINNLQIGLEQLPSNLYSLTFGIRFPNFRNQGDGIYLKAQTLIRGSLEDYSYFFKYNEPWLFGSKIPFNLVLWHQVNKENILGTSSSVSVRRRGWEANIQPINFEDRKLLLGYTQEDVADITTTRNPYYKSAVRFAFIQNNINNINHPLKGTMHSLEIEKGNNLFGVLDLGGIPYAKYEFKYSIFQDLLDYGVLGIHAELGYLDSPDGAILLFEQDMFSVGGPYSLRGYKDAYANPATAISGTKKVLLNIEYRTLLLSWLQFAVFTDWGYASSHSMSLSDFKWGGGFGLRFFTPLVPVRLDFGYSEKESLIFYFALGQMF